MLDKVRHAQEKGKILQTLREDFGERMTTVRNLMGALDLQGFPMTAENLQFSLAYLSESGFVAVVRAKETAAWRADRVSSISPEFIVSAKLTVRGLHLIDGMVPADPLVSF